MFSLKVTEMTFQKWKQRDGKEILDNIFYLFLFIL